MDLINCYLLYIRTYFFQDKRPWLVDEDPKANGLYVSTVKKKKKGNEHKIRTWKN